MVYLVGEYGSLVVDAVDSRHLERRRRKIDQVHVLSELICGMWRRQKSRRWRNANDVPVLRRQVPTPGLSPATSIRACRPPLLQPSLDTVHLEGSTLNQYNQ